MGNGFLDHFPVIEIDNLFRYKGACGNNFLVKRRDPVFISIDQDFFGFQIVEGNGSMVVEGVFQRQGCRETF